MKAMALERGDRYSDTGELATDIEHWLADETYRAIANPPDAALATLGARVTRLGVAGFVALSRPLFRRFV